MKVLLINHMDIGGGAAKAAVRLVTALNEHGIYARLGVSEKKSSSLYVFNLPKKNYCLFAKVFRKINRFASKFFAPITKRLPHPCAFRTTNEILHTTNFTSETDIDWINNSDFDIINLHWISGVICNKDIAKIKKPIVWTMHDTWPFCGAEHYPNILENDIRYKNGYLKSNKPISTKGIDLCRKVWMQKKRYLSNKEISFISPSNWEKKCLNESALFSGKKCFVIPNILPSVFEPLDKCCIRNLMSIPKEKKIIGFGAAYDIDNPKGVKGSYYLINALSLLDNPSEYFIVVFGNAGSTFLSQLKIPYFASGFISNERILSMLYNSCDVFVCPSIIENLPFTCLESIFCGIPVVAFNVGGIPDIVEHKVTGFLATPYKTEELVEGIEWCIKNQTELSKNCIEKSLHDFDEEKTINQYLKVISEIRQDCLS